MPSRVRPRPHFALNNYVDDNVYKISRDDAIARIKVNSKAPAGIPIKFTVGSDPRVREVDINFIRNQGIRHKIFMCPKPGCGVKLCRRPLVNRHVLAHAGRGEHLPRGMKWFDHPTVSSYIDYSRLEADVARRAATRATLDNASNAASGGLFAQLPLPTLEAPMPSNGGIGQSKSNANPSPPTTPTVPGPAFPIYPIATANDRGIDQHLSYLQPSQLPFRQFLAELQPDASGMVTMHIDRFKKSLYGQYCNGMRAAAQDRYIIDGHLAQNPHILDPALFTQAHRQGPNSMRNGFSNYKVVGYSTSSNDSFDFNSTDGLQHYPEHNEPMQGVTTNEFPDGQLPMDLQDFPAFAGVDLTAFNNFDRFSVSDEMIAEAEQEPSSAPTSQEDIDAFANFIFGQGSTDMSEDSVNAAVADFGHWSSEEMTSAPSDVDASQSSLGLSEADELINLEWDAEQMHGMDNGHLYDEMFPN